MRLLLCFVFLPISIFTQPIPYLTSNFPASMVSSFTSSHEHTLVLFTNRTPSEVTLEQIFKNLAPVLNKDPASPVYCLQVRRKRTPFTKSGYPRKFFPGLSLYIQGVERKYKGPWNQDKIENWVTNMIHSKVMEIDSVKDVKSMDLHCVILTNYDFYDKKRTLVEQLATLIHPIQVFVVDNNKSFLKLAKLLNKDTKDKKENKRKPGLLMYKPTENNVEELLPAIPLPEIAEYILAAQYPEKLHCDSLGKDLIFEHNRPTLLYFTEKKNDPFISIVRKTVAKSDTLLSSMIVVREKKKPDAYFFRRFMEVDKMPALRIIHAAPLLYKYKVEEEPTEEVLTKFIEDFNDGKLTHFFTNEDTKGREMKRGLYRTNFKGLEWIFGKRKKFSLVLFYSGIYTETRFEMKMLNKLQAICEREGEFRVFTLNHDVNDIDGFYKKDLPYLVLVAPDGQYWEYRKDINFDEVYDWIKELFPQFDVEVPIFEGDL